MNSKVPASKPAKPKRRKSAASRPATREPTPDEALYEIRDIIDEKYVKGRLLYKVDWADNPTTGEKYDPTWEPAGNVTEAAVADWESEKRRRQGLASDPKSSNPTETDSQPVLSPNWRAKRRRDHSATEEEDRAPRRTRGSVDSGYTSTDGDAATNSWPSSWEPVQSLPENKGELVLEIPRPAGFDPSEYRVISSSQSVPSSQAASLSLTNSQQTGGLVSQRTIPDSQDFLDSLRTRSTAQSTINDSFLDSGSTHPVSQSARVLGSTQEAGQDQDQDQDRQDTEGQTSRHGFDIPSHQPGQGSHGDSGPPSGLLESGDSTQNTIRDSIGHPFRQLPGELESSLGDNPWGEGLLTQLEYQLPISLDVVDRVEERLSGHSHPSLHEQANPTPLGHSSFALEDSNLHFQDAQRTSLLDINPEPQFLTQVSQVPGVISQDLIPETVQKPSKRQYPSQTPNQSASSPLHRGQAHPSTPTQERSTSLPVNMEGSGDGAPRQSVVDKLRKLQEDVFGSSPGQNTAPANPQNQKVDGPIEGDSRPSAVEKLRQFTENSFGTSPESVAPVEARQEPTLVSPSAILPQTGSFAEHLEASTAPQDDTSLNEQPLLAVQDFNQGVGIDFGSHSGGAIGGAGHSMEFDHQPATVAPSDLTTSIEHIPSVHDDSSGDQILGGSLEEEPHSTLDVEQDQFPHDMGTDEQEEDDDDSHIRHFTVTLPMAANTRATYLETIRENKSTMITFAEVFANSVSSVPDDLLVAKIDDLFGRLLDLCDLPAYDHDLPELSKEEMMKHATNSNSKFSFVYEFLQGLRDINVRILIFSAEGRIFDYLEAVVAATGCPYTILGEEAPTGQEPTEGASVVLAVAGEDLSMVEEGIDVVIAFDHTARSVELPATLGYDNMAPIVLSLVATYSLDHIGQQLLQSEQGMDSFEKKNALNLATVTSKDYLRNPESQHIAPHEAAQMFTNFLRNPEIGLDWEPQPLPADIFELWLSSQERTQAAQAHVYQSVVLNGPGRKRPLDTVDEGTPKRLRLLESQRPSRNATPARMSDLLRQTLTNHAVGTTTQAIEVPVEQLEKMSDKIAELEARLATQSAVDTKMREHFTSLESQLRSHERTVQTLQPRFMEAIRDRGTFEKECQKAVEKANAATERLAAKNAEIEALKEKNKVLESKLAEANDALANSTVPEIAKLAQAEKDRQEALAAVEKLEKKIRGVQNEAEYSRKAYQDASNAHTELSKENQELKAQVAELGRRASENLLKIHQIHAQNEVNEILKHLDEVQALRENRERELERAKEELKYLKNGRRETRQGSVPRSPRTGVMSPRPARGMGGPGSRGTSPAPLSSDGPGVGGGGAPVPGMTFFPPVGNAGRWGHLRD